MPDTLSSLAEERLRLEREALAVERDRLAAVRAHAEAVSDLTRTRRTLPLVIGCIVLAACAFAGGVLTGFLWQESRIRQAREARLAQALSRIGDLSTATTNAPAASRDVSVFVIQ